MECRRRRSGVERSETEEWSDSESTEHTGFAKQNAWKKLNKMRDAVMFD